MVLKGVMVEMVVVEVEITIVVLNLLVDEICVGVLGEGIKVRVTVKVLVMVVEVEGKFVVMGVVVVKVIVEVSGDGVVEEAMVEIGVINSRLFDLPCRQKGLSVREGVLRISMKCQTFNDKGINFPLDS